MATIPEAYSIALKHYQGGRLQAAEQIYRQILAADPCQPDAAHLLGVIAYRVGNHEQAVAYMSRAISLQEPTALFHNNLGEVYRVLGKIPEAIASCRRALALESDYAEAHYNLGNALKDERKLDEAIACFRRAVEIKSDFAEAYSNLGVACREQRNLEEAMSCCRRAVELQPGFVEAHVNLGVALKDLGKLEESAASYRQALRLKPDHAEAHNNLGVILRELSQLDEAAAQYRRALELKPNFAGAHNNLGAIFKEQRKLEQAIACYRRALELQPDFAGAHNNLGIALRSQGKAEEAVECYRRALELEPGFAEARANLGRDLQERGDFQGAEDYFRAALKQNGRLAFAHYDLAALLGGKLPEEDLAALRHLLEEKELTGSQRMMLHFGLAHVLDARGEYDAAAENSIIANALALQEWKTSGQANDVESHGGFIDRIMAEFTPEFFARVAGFGVASERPVFVVGLPRSGTSLVEQILSSHSHVFGAGELNLAREAFAAATAGGMKPGTQLASLDRQSIPQLAQRHLEELGRRNADALRVVDKMPDNYFYLGFLAAQFPRARFIHCRRDLRDVAVSCWMTNFREIRWANDPGHIAARFGDYLRLMEHWRKSLPVPLLEVVYEETVTDLEAAARRLVSWCGLEWEPKCLEFHLANRPVRTASAVQVRQPVSGKSVGRWKHYERSLAGLLSAIPRDP
jgi:tetratricopeptide (TPR) repeat protein